MALSVISSTNGAFQLIGTPRWIPGGLAELDALELTYQGAYTQLSTFRATLTKWMPSQLDGSMFLENFPDDGDSVKPKVTLRFVGFRNGIASAGKKESGQTVQSASSTKGFSAPGGLGPTSSGSFTAEIQYYSPTNVHTWLSTVEGAGGSADEPSGSIQLISARINGGDVPSNFSADVLSIYFSDQTTSVTQSEELVPGHYWRNTNIKNLIKIPSSLVL